MFLRKYFEKIKPIWPEICAFSVFFIISCLWLKYHETWLDESQAWLIARDADSYWKMIKLMSYEGHPALWHSLLFILAKLKLPFFSMRILHLIIANITAYLILFKSPFKRSVKIPLIFGYFLIYEYNAIGRSYALAVMLIFLIAAIYQKRFEKTITYSLLLALLANTVIHGTVIAFAIFLLFIYELIVNNINNLKNISKKQYLAIAIVLTSFLLVIFQVKPTTDSTMDLPWLQTKTAAQPLVSLVSAFYPIPENIIVFGSSLAILDPIKDFINPIYGWYWYAIVLIFVSISTFLLSLLFFAGKTRIFNLYIIIVFLLSLIFLIINSGFIRHFGLIYISFIFCLWLAEYYEKKSGLKNTNFDHKFLDIILYFFLAIQLTAGIVAGYTDTIFDFSSAKKTATYLQNNDFITDNTLLIGYHSNPTASILAYLPNTKFYYIEYNAFGTYVIWNKQYASFLKSSFDEHNRQSSDTIKKLSYKRYILITSYPLSPTEFILRYKLLKYFTSTIVAGESFYIYEIFPTDNPAYRPESDQQ